MWRQRVRDLLDREVMIVVQVQAATGDLTFAVAGQPGVKLSPDEAHTLRELLAVAAAQALTDRGTW